MTNELVAKLPMTQIQPFDLFVFCEGVALRKKVSYTGMDREAITNSGAGKRCTVLDTS